MWFETLFESQLFCLHFKMLAQRCNHALFRLVESCTAFILEMIHHLGCLIIVWESVLSFIADFVIMEAFTVVLKSLLLLWFDVNKGAVISVDVLTREYLSFSGAAWWEEAVGAACWGHSPWLRMSVRDGAATMATNAGGGGGGGGTASPNDQDGRSYLLQIYPRLAAQSTTCCNLRWVCRSVTAREAASTAMMFDQSLVIASISLEFRRMQQQPQWSQMLPRNWGWTLAACMC